MSDDGRPEESGPVRAAHPGGGRLLLTRHFTAETVTGLRHLLTGEVAGVGLAGDTLDDFVLAVHELVTNAVRHGGGSGRLELWRYDDALRCEVVDHGAGTAGLPVDRPAGSVPGGRGLWLAHQLADGLTLNHRADGLTATVVVCLPEQSESGLPPSPADAGPRPPLQVAGGDQPA